MVNHEYVKENYDLIMENDNFKLFQDREDGEELIFFSNISEEYYSYKLDTELGD